MSKTTTVEFAGRAFWTFAGNLSILLATIVQVAEDMPDEGRPDWLTEPLASVRISAVITDFGFRLDDGWDGDRLTTFRLLLDQAIERLRVCDMVSAVEAATWNILDGHSIDWRGAETVNTAGSVALGEGIVQLMEGTLPVPPAGTWWIFMPDGERTTVDMHGDREVTG
jgi:hypothetical protein